MWDRSPLWRGAHWLLSEWKPLSVLPKFLTGLQLCWKLRKPHIQTRNTDWPSILTDLTGWRGLNPDFHLLLRKCRKAVALNQWQLLPSVIVKGTAILMNKSKWWYSNLSLASRARSLALYLTYTKCSKNTHPLNKEWISCSLYHPSLLPPPPPPTTPMPDF